MGECQRGYFEFETKEDGLYLTVYPPKTDMRPVSINEILYYVEKRKLYGCDSATLSEACKAGASQITCLKISDEKPHPFQEFGDYRISSDAMRVEAVFYPPFKGADCLSSDEIKKDLKSIGVKYGFDEEAIASFLDKKNYFDSVIVAKGTEPRQGCDGYVEYKFNPDLKPAPKMNEDGTVDFHTLEVVNNVQKDQVVAVLHPEDRGYAGKDVYDRFVMPKAVGHVIFHHGRNVRLSEDGKELISDVNGHVVLDGEKILVFDVLELENVDTSSGDVDYKGNVKIKGNVQAGFKVKASGDVIVGGLVEGATIEAGGNITLNRGVQGMTKARIIAGGNIVSKFLESAELVQAGGYIETDSILHSKVLAKDKIVATGRNGLIVGGDVRSIVLIEATNIGNEMGTNTTVGVGLDPAAKRKVDSLKKDLSELGNKKIQLKQIVTSLRKMQDSGQELDDNKKQMQSKTMTQMLLIDKELNEKKKELDNLKSQITEETNARIKVRGDVFVGTRLIFGDQSMFVKEKYSYCQFMKERADIKLMAL